MSGRVRAAGFATGALVCAALSAALASSAAGPAGTRDSELRDVVAVQTALERGTTLGKREVTSALAVRRVPAAFVPPDALGSPAEASGRRLLRDLPPGSYVTASDFATGASRGPARRDAPAGTTPVEIEVVGAEALAATRTGIGEAVDVVVSGDSLPGPGAGRTYVAAEDVTLLGLREAEAETGLARDRWIATLALERGDALSLIRAEGAVASIRLLAG